MGMAYPNPTPPHPCCSGFSPPLERARAHRSNPNPNPPPRARAPTQVAAAYEELQMRDPTGGASALLASFKMQRLLRQARAAARKLRTNKLRAPRKLRTTKLRAPRKLRTNELQALLQPVHSQLRCSGSSARRARRRANSVQTNCRRFYSFLGPYIHSCDAAAPPPGARAAQTPYKQTAGASTASWARTFTVAMQRLLRQARARLAWHMVQHRLVLLSVGNY